MQVQLKEHPFVSTITAAYRPNETKLIDYTRLGDWVADRLAEHTTILGTDPPRGTPFTKNKTQLHVPLPFVVEGEQLFFRIRYVSYVKRGTKRGNFMNQLCFYYRTPDTNKKRCFKVFCNGLVHVTGYNSLDVMDTRFTEFYNALFLVVHAHNLHLRVHDAVRSIYVINMTIKMAHTLYLPSASVFLATHINQWSISYEPELYCAMSIDAGHFKANVFGSGSIIVTGVKSMLALETARSQLLAVFNQHFDALFAKPNQTSNKPSASHCSAPSMPHAPHS